MEQDGVVENLGHWAFALALTASQTAVDKEGHSVAHQEVACHACVVDQAVHLVLGIADSVVYLRAVYPDEAFRTSLVSWEVL